MDNPILLIVMRYVHIVSAILAVGGTSYVLFCLLPALRRVEDQATRDLVSATAGGQFLRVVWVSIAGLVISGAYNWMMLAGTYKAMGPIGNALIGAKTLLAVILFGLIWANATGLFKPRSPRTYLMINIHLAAVVILLGSILRYFRLTYPTDLVAG